MTLMYSKPRWNHVMMELADRETILVKFFCSALAIVVFYQIRSVDCGTFLSSLTTKTYQTNGRQCYKCSPGQFWVGDCTTPGEVARCQPCTTGSFQAVENVATTCQQCTKDCTQKNQELIEACNSTTDNICQCSSGYFKLNYEGFCKKHKTCAPGEWAISPGNKDRDTICESCLAGKTFSSNGSGTEGCSPCTSCEVKGLYEIIPCTVKSDAQCATSRPPDGSHNIGVIVGGTFGSLIVVLIILVVFWYYKRHRRNLQSPEDDSQRNNLSNQPAPANSDGIESDPAPEEVQLIEFKDQGIDSPVLRQLSTDLIDRNWKFFFRELSVQETDIEQVEQDQGTVKEQIYKLLLQLNRSGTLTKSNIRGALMKRGRNDLVAKYCSDS